MMAISGFIFLSSGCPSIGNQLGEIIMKHLFIFSLIALALCVSCNPKAEVHSVTQDAPKAEEQIKPEVKEDVKADEAKADEVKEDVKADEAKADEAKADEAKADEAKPEVKEEVKAEEAKQEVKEEVKVEEAKP